MVFSGEGSRQVIGYSESKYLGSVNWADSTLGRMFVLYNDLVRVLHFFSALYTVSLWHVFLLEFNFAEDITLLTVNQISSCS